MATHNLEEHPDLFITRGSYDDKFVYKMIHISGEQNWYHVQSIDLRSDKLVIYGTEIKESALVRLHQSLIFRGRNGCVAVNCHGACYFSVEGKGLLTPVHNVIFDWSQFGVTVPNSINDSLRKELEQKEKQIEKMNQQLSSAEAEACSTNVALEALKKEIEELKEQLSACKRDRDDMEEKLQKESQNMEVELRKLCDQLSSAKSELQSATTHLELSKGRVMQLDQQLSTYEKERQNMELELQKLQGQLSLVNSELQSTKTLLESSNRIVKESEDLVAVYRMESLAKQADLQKVRDELSSVHVELYSTKSQLESSKERVKELEEKLSASKKESQEIGVELQKVQCQLSLLMQELQFSKSLLESLVKMLQELKDQREDVHGGVELQKLLQHLWSKVKSTRQRLEDLLTELNHRWHSQWSRIQCSSTTDNRASSKCSLLRPEECNITPSFLVTHELPISMTNLPVSIAIEEDIHVQCLNDVSEDEN